MSCMLFSDFCCFFFFKQKTAYEMRISDWSSDVCSSDLREHHSRRARYRSCRLHLRRAAGDDTPRHAIADASDGRAAFAAQVDIVGEDHGFGRGHLHFERALDLDAGPLQMHRSEEHTSELQSLMRISYAVFCLKKKTQSTTLTKCTYNIK